MNQNNPDQKGSSPHARSDAKVYLVPAFLHEHSGEVIPNSVIDAVKQCQVFFVENERSARRYLKSIWKEMVIDNYRWYLIQKHSTNVHDKTANDFLQEVRKGSVIGIISEAGCPGIADPGQSLVSIAHKAGAVVKPLVGPSSILLAVMASGMNGQQFQFVGYLPIDNLQKIKAIRDLEAESQKKNCTQVFIETPYRNNQLVESILKNCKPATRLCIAVDITGKNEWIKTKTVGDWHKNKPDIHKKPAIFLLYAGEN